MPMNPKLHLEKHSYRFAYMKKANLPDRSIVAPALTEDGGSQTHSPMELKAVQCDHMDK